MKDAVSRSKRQIEVQCSETEVATCVGGTPYFQDGECNDCVLGVGCGDKSVGGVTGIQHGLDPILLGRRVATESSAPKVLHNVRIGRCHSTKRVGSVGGHEEETFT